MNKEIKYKLVVHDHLDSVMHRKTVNRNIRKEKKEKETTAKKRKE